MTASEFTLTTVRRFMLDNGGKVKNHELVTHFKSFLNDPHQKALMRDKFKDFVNTLATIKTDENGDKILVLKKKYRDNQGPLDMARAFSEPPSGADNLDGAMPSKVLSESNLSTTQSKSSVSLGSSTNDTTSLSVSVSASSLSSGQSDEDVNASVISVKDRAKHLNKMDSESDIRLEEVSPLGRKKESKNRDDGEESTGSVYVTFEPIEKQWLVTASSAEYHPIHQLLSKHPGLARVKDFTNTALHWAAKQGQPDVIKMLVGKPGVNVNQRTGYTPLHLAAIHGHENVIELLVQAYKADPNIRDYSGKKAKQYLRNSASSRAQQYLASTRLGSKTSKLGDDQFLRGGSARKSNRARAISSLIQASTGGIKHAMLRTNWSSSEDVRDGREGSTTPNPSPRHTPNPSPRSSAEPSPVSLRRATICIHDQESHANTEQDFDQSNAIQIEQIQPSVEQVQPIVEQVQPSVEQIQPSVEHIQQKIDHGQGREGQGREIDGETRKSKKVKSWYNGLLCCTGQRTGHMDNEMMPPPSNAARRNRYKAHSTSKENLHTRDGKQVPRSESEPNLGDVLNPRSKSMYI